MEIYTIWQVLQFHDKLDTNPRHQDAIFTNVNERLGLENRQQTINFIIKHIVKCNIVSIGLNPRRIAKDKIKSIFVNHYTPIRELIPAIRKTIPDDALSSTKST